jgi:hypothetical protein
VTWWFLVMGHRCKFCPLYVYSFHISTSEHCGGGKMKYIFNNICTVYVIQYIICNNVLLTGSIIGKSSNYMGISPGLNFNTIIQILKTFINLWLHSRWWLTFLYFCLEKNDNFWSKLYTFMLLRRRDSNPLSPAPGQGCEPHTLCSCCFEAWPGQLGVLLHIVIIPVGQLAVWLVSWSLHHQLPILATHVNNWCKQTTVFPSLSVVFVYACTVQYMQACILQYPYI